MILETKGLRVFIYQEAIDMRCGFDKLSFFIRDKMRSSIDSGNLFLFLGKNRKRLKALYFDGSGLVIVHKRMEKTSFMNVADLGDVREISLAELKLIFHGSVLRKFVIDRMMQNKKAENTILPRGSVFESSHAST
jgi:transposase